MTRRFLPALLLLVLLASSIAYTATRNLSGVEMETTELPEQLRCYKRLLLPVSVSSGTTTTLLNAPATGSHIDVIAAMLQAQGGALNFYFKNAQTTVAAGTTSTADLAPFELLGDGATFAWDAGDKPIKIATHTALQIVTTAGTLKGWVQAYVVSDTVQN